MLLTFSVVNQLITRTDCEIPVANSKNYLYAQFSFSDEWQGVKTAIFKGESAYTLQLDEDNKCLVPWEAIAFPGFSVSVFCGDLITANSVFVDVVPSGYSEGETPRPPSPTVYDQILADLAKKLEADNIIAGTNVTIDKTGKNIIINASGGGTPFTVDSTLRLYNNVLGIDFAKEILDELEPGKAVRSNEFMTALRQIGEELADKQPAGDYATASELSAEETARQNADINLQGQIDAITVSTDVIDVVGTYADLQSYDSQHVKANDIIKVLQDSTHNDALSYYRWVITENIGAWVYVGSEGPFYTKAESDTKFQDKMTIGYGLSLNGTTLSLNGRSGKIVDTLPLINIDVDTDYLTKATRPTYNYGDYCSNKVLYPTDDLPSFNSLRKQEANAVIYNGYDDCFYFISVNSTYGVGVVKFSSNSNKLSVYCDDSFTVRVYKYDPTSTFEWALVFTDTARNSTVQLIDVTTNKKFKWLWIDSNASHTTPSYDNTYTLSAQSTGSNIIYANFFNTSGEFLDNDDDNVDESDVYIFNINQYRNSTWVVSGQLDLQNLMEKFLKANQGSANAGKFLKVGINGNIEYDTVNVTVDTAMSDSSTNAVQNKVIKSYVDTSIDDTMGEALMLILTGGTTV